uniref:Uncharacterized protein n=1 Tax=Spironucleus salmonicida TaxID=348837 RepID=V6LQY1_9EUKA|eukprot:EST43154.1 Hypothetical protein SS50377_17211 [Spironucleus salmonicida]
MPPRSTSSRRNLKGSSFLLQNEEILNEIRQPLTPPAVHPHNLGQELEAIRSHQRAHDDLLRDLTHQIAQTNVTVFRQKVAENFTNLKEGFTLIQKERRVEKESLSQHKKDTGRQIKEFQGDFLEFAQILKRFEGRLQDMQAQALRRELKQQSQIAVLKQVLKRSGVYNHFLMGEHGAPAAVQSKAAAALQHGSSPAEIEALLQKQAALFDQKLQQLDEKLVQNEQITHQLIEQRTTLHTQQTAQISERTALRLDHFEEDLQRSERGLQQVRDDWLAKVDAVQAQQRFLQETQGQVNLNVEAESQRFAAFMSSARLHAEQTTHDLKAVKERVALVQTQKEEAECHFQQFKMEYQTVHPAEQDPSHTTSVWTTSATNQEKILLKLESQEAVSTMLGDKYKECFDEIQSVLMSTKQSNFEASQIVSRQVQQYQEMRLRLADHIERVNVQSMNDLIQKKVELDTIQFQGTLNKLAGHLRDLDERLTGQETMIVHGQNHTAELIQTIVNQPTSLEELEDYHAVPMDDFSQIEPMRQVGKPKAGKKVKLDSNRQLMLQQQLSAKPRTRCNSSSTRSPSQRSGSARRVSATTSCRAHQHHSVGADGPNAPESAEGRPAQHRRRLGGGAAQSGEGQHQYFPTKLPARVIVPKLGADQVSRHRDVTERNYRAVQRLYWEACRPGTPIPAEARGSNDIVYESALNYRGCVRHAHRAA